MEVDLITSGVSEDDAFEVYDDNDGSTFEGERCGICMDFIIDRGVLDCCQHWFCFICIDNWATITNLCPLCQNEFQLITCVPVYDTIGNNKVDEDSFSRDDDWCIEGRNNTLSFPSYYIDENAVTCLDGDGCKIRSGSASIVDDSNLDTSIACDSCDIWYHAFCVGFDPESTSENSWLCPRCVNGTPGISNGEYLIEATVSGKVSVSVADAGETAVVVSMVEGNQWSEPSEKSLSISEVNKDTKMEALLSSSSILRPKLETSSEDNIDIQANMEGQGLELSLSRDASLSLSSTSMLLNNKKTSSFADKTNQESSTLDGSRVSCMKTQPLKNDTDITLDLGLSVGSSLAVVAPEGQGGINVQQKHHLEESPISSDTVAPVENGALKVAGRKRKHTVYRDGAHMGADDGDMISEIETRVSAKKIKVVRNCQLLALEANTNGSALDDSKTCYKDVNTSLSPEKKTATSDIMSVVRGSRLSKRRGTADKSSKETEHAAGLRVKKIMRRAEDKESSAVVQNLRKEIREAVGNRSTKDFGKKLFDPKLLAAFRAAIAGTVTQPDEKLPPLVAKVKKPVLQKGKTRDNLTKKIYANSNGRRRRAWDRDCEIEFWKHRCSKSTKPEKVETLKSVLDLLRESSEMDEEPEGKAILSRLYLADSSVFPRNQDIKPLSALKPAGNADTNTLIDQASKSSLDKRAIRAPPPNKVPTQIGVPSSVGKGSKISTPSVKNEAASGKPASLPGGSSVSKQKMVVEKSGDRSDKRKWALEVLARKTSVAGRDSTHEKHEDNAVLKGNYPLLAQLPIDMRPAFAPSRHNKIPSSIRQTQLYRLTEHFLRKANLPAIRRTAETELAIADAINIEKEVANKSNSKLVYVNLCSQELLHRSDNTKSNAAAEPNDVVPSGISTNQSEIEESDLSTDLAVEEALRNTGLLSDSPPNSPRQVEEPKDEDVPLTKVTDEGPENVFEIDSHPELDIYGDFEYDLEDEDYIGASVTKVSKLQSEEGESKMKVVFSTLKSDKLNDTLVPEEPERSGIVAMPEEPPPEPLCADGSEEPSVAECEELYGPDKEPLIARFPEQTYIVPEETAGPEAAAEKVVSGNDVDMSNREVKASEFGSEGCPETAFADNVRHGSSGGENSPNHSETGGNVHKKVKKSHTDAKKQTDCSNHVSKKVEAYVKEHIRPLCKSGVITAEQYRWAVGRTTEKVMKYHSRAEDATFLIKEGEKVKKLAEQYVATSQQKKKK